MKKAISNIAWDTKDDNTIAVWLTEYGFDGIEVAPTKIWPDFPDVPPSEVERYRNFWERKGLQIEAMQSILFGKADLTLFDSPQKRDETIQHLKKVIEIAAGLEVRKIVFGSPKNRRTPPDMSAREAENIAVGFFSTLADHCVPYQIFFCIEANPEIYGANYITNTMQALSLLKKVSHPNFRLHLDTGILYLNKEDIAHTIGIALPSTMHVHVSEPYLDPIGTHPVPHDQYADTLKKGNYNQWVSIEMRPSSSDGNLEAVQTSLQKVAAIY